MYAYYFHVFQHNDKNAIVFGSYALVMVVLFLAYWRFVRFMERA